MHLFLHLQQIFAIQIPLFDSIVPRTAEEIVPLDHQGLNAIVVGGLKVVHRADGPQRAFTHIKQLQEQEACL